MRLPAAYCERVRCLLESELRQRYGADARVVLRRQRLRRVLDITANGWQFVHPVVAGAYHVEPDGSNAQEYASWLVEYFDEHSS